MAHRLKSVDGSQSVLRSRKALMPSNAIPSLDSSRSLEFATVPQSAAPGTSSRRATAQTGFRTACAPARRRRCACRRRSARRVFGGACARFERGPNHQLTDQCREPGLERGDPFLDLVVVPISRTAPAKSSRRGTCAVEVVEERHSPATSCARPGGRRVLDHCGVEDLRGFVDGGGFSSCFEPKWA